ncbi:MAG: glycine--tRNA ligase subunit beta [Anaerolineae bacterium]|nr:glycine--tRNA ligase subunit beta [Anaerolineae bacterium]
MASDLFQNVIMALHDFWAKQGCLLWQPYNVQVGAGTGNPATLLRVLGPEPWRVAYVEPSVRPDDGRYGENPNRMQLYYQYQVILKPDPGNPQELYLQSLEAVGIDLRKHDVRFVEDNWKSPALGAWGLGWEVWLDGQEITQFTYFQQGGGIKLDPVSVEITYGMERIVLALQGRNAAWDIQWTDDVTYRDIFLQSEIEHCKYYFDVADVDSLKQVYDTYERESQRALAAGLVVPSYDYVLKCSHLFNVLDTRGAIGVTERANYFRRMAAMTRNVAKAYLDQRQRLEFPMINNGRSWPVAPNGHGNLAKGNAPTTPADVLLEIGTEELPAGDLDDALAQLTKSADALFQDARLDHAGIEVSGTPRRLVVLARGVAPRQPDEEKIIKGPPANKAFDTAGNPTPVAEGFARKQGIAVSDLLRIDEGGQYVGAKVKSIGKPAVEVLGERLPQLIAGIKFGETMRWNSSGVFFSRPIRWIVALIGDAVIPFEYAGVASSRVTRGTRATGSHDLSVENASDYLSAMQSRGVVLSREQRKAIIMDGATKLAQEIGGTLYNDPKLLGEVANLVEQPTVLRGTFESRFLELPRDVLITVMRKHQRYFAVEDANGKLLPYFIAVRNGDAEHLDEVIYGNEHVLTARFSDADFFFRDDRQHKLADRIDRLKTMTFQEKLGSLYDKNQRLVSYVEPFGELLDLNVADMQTAYTAAQIAKADQATRMVVEMTSLEGVMGREYSLMEGHPAPVANAILAHYRPQDVRQLTSPGILLALADRLDSLVGLFAVGLAPTASADPFALRRAALGVVQVLLDNQIDLDLRQAIKIVAARQPVPVSDEVQADVVTFIAGRLRVLLLDERGFAYDVVDAGIAEQGHNPYRALVGVQELSAWVQRGDWSNILDSFARCVRITRDKPAYILHPENLTPEESVALYQDAKRAHDRLSAQDNVNAFLTAFEPIVPTITEFFNKVLVMDENPAIRENRLALLQYVASLAKGRADLSRLSGF